MLLPLLALACDPAPPAPSPGAPQAPQHDILLVTIDTLRADRLGTYGDTLAQTPNIDGLAAQAAVFREAHTLAPLTLPAHAALMTGKHPAELWLRDNGGRALANHHSTLAEKLKAQGYQTAAFVSAFVLDSAFGLDQGFDRYHDPFHPQDVAEAGAFGEVELPSAEVINDAVAWWKDAGRRTDAPRFAWVHLYDPHTPWRAHAGWEGDPYRGEIAHVDSLLGRLLDEVGPDSWVVLTSDHGESLWEGGEREHGILLGPAATRVPLIIRPPGGIEGAATADPLPGPRDLRRPDGLDGDLVLDAPLGPVRGAQVVSSPTSLLEVAPLLSGQHSLAQLPTAPMVRAETWYPTFHLGWSPMRMAQDADGRVEIGARSQAYGTAGAALEAHATALDSVGPTRPGQGEADQIAALEALGYLATTPEDVGHWSTLPDPRDLIESFARLQGIAALPDPRDQVGQLEALLATQPGMVDAGLALSLAHVAAGQPEIGLGHALELVARWPRHPQALNNAAVLARHAQDHARAQELATTLTQVNPADARGWRILAALGVDQEDPGAVRVATSSGLDAAPDDPNLHYLAGLAALQVGSPPEAIAHLQAARTHGSRATDISLWLGLAHDKAGEIDTAITHFESASRELQGDLRPWVAAGLMLVRAQRCEEATRFLENAIRRGARDPNIAAALQACQPPK